MAEHGALATLKDLAEKEVDDAALLLGEMRRGFQRGRRTAHDAARLPERIPQQPQQRYERGGLPVIAGLTTSSLFKPRKKRWNSIASS